MSLPSTNVQILFLYISCFLSSLSLPLPLSSSGDCHNFKKHRKCAQYILVVLGAVVMTGLKMNFC